MAKQGRTLQALAQEIERQQHAKRDLLAETTRMAMTAEADLDVAGEVFPILSHAHDQIGQRVGVPAKYYDKMLTQAPELLATNINHWLHENPERRMVRTLDGDVRAFLSDRYKPLEHFELLEAALPVMLEQQLQIIACEVTERRLYVKAVAPTIQKDIPRGMAMDGRSSHVFDTLSPAIVLSNSEVGSGALSIETAVWTRACTNLCIMAQKSMRKYHVGGRAEVGEGVYDMFSDGTKRLTDAATWAQARDVIRGAFDQAKFDALTDEIAGMSQRPINGDPVKVVELAQKRFGFSEDERGSVMRHLIAGADLSQYGLFNAITRTAEDVDSFDRATEIERFGGQVIELAPNEWRVLADAA